MYDFFFFKQSFFPRENIYVIKQDRYKRENTGYYQNWEVDGVKTSV